MLSIQIKAFDLCRMVDEPAVNQWCSMLSVCVDRRRRRTWGRSEHRRWNSVASQAAQTCWTLHWILRT